MVAKSVLESDLLEETEDRYELTGLLSTVTIPASLHDSLMARLDRLGSIKELAQVGAAIGRTFSYELLATVASMPEDRLRRGLDQLVASELVFARGSPPGSTYSFKHALVQDAAYQSLLKTRRQELHEKIAAVLEDRFPKTAESEPELLAHHLSEAGRIKEAVTTHQPYFYPFVLASVLLLAASLAIKAIPAFIEIS